MSVILSPAVAAPPGFVESLGAKAMSPGWAKRKPQMWPSPKPRHIPAVWRYADARAALDQACEFVSPALAERRNLILVNPIEDNIYPTCQTLVAAYQLVLPGETARSHRHAPNALRLVLDAGSGVHTIVDGVKVDMAPGDVLLTPSWCWHGHSNFGSEPAFWIDFLDVPLVQHLECMFFEDHPDRNEAPVAHEPDSVLRNKGIALEAAMRQQGTVEIAPGGLKTIGLQAIGLKQGQSQGAEKDIISNIFAVTAGRVRMDVEQLGEVELTRGDVIVIPSWHAYAIEGDAPWSQLVRVNDAPVMHALGFTAKHSI